MKSAILNSALKQIAQNTNSGFWLSITHFSLAWASEAEKSANPVNPSMSELVQQSTTSVVATNNGTGNGTASIVSYGNSPIYEEIIITIGSAQGNYTVTGSISGTFNGVGQIGDNFNLVNGSGVTLATILVRDGSVPFRPNDTLTFYTHPTVLGDIIYNLWQTPFSYDQYAGSFDQLSQNVSAYYQYEYDTCNYRNVLQLNQNLSQTQRAQYTDPATWPGNINAFNTKYGYSNPSSSNVNGLNNPHGTSNYSELTAENIPVPLKYDINGTNAKYGVTPYSKLFPIKAYTLINENDNSDKVTINFNLDLPAISSSIADKINFYANSIGNFKFNRVGLYMTKCTKQDPTQASDSKDVYRPLTTEEPILFAVIDIGVDSCTSNDVRFDVYKTRDDSGFSGWDFDAQLNISNASPCLAQSDPTFYVDAVRDEATRYYQAQMMNNASMAETIMQLQMMVLQLANRVEEISGISPLTSLKTSGYNLNAILDADREYSITDSDSTNKMLLDATAFRGSSSNGVNVINSHNALFSLGSDSAADGDFVKVTIFNLDGRYYSVNSSGSAINVHYWNGELIFANYSETSGAKTILFKIDASLIEGLTFAKVSVLFSYNSALLTWVVENVSIINETNYISA